MTDARPVWRSLLYVPAHVEKFVASAHTRGADAVILDLEDSVPLEQKTVARGALAHAVARVDQAGADVMVRINAAPELQAQDLEAAVAAGAVALSLPKIESPEEIRRLEGLAAQAEAAAGRPIGGVRFILIIESAKGFLRMAELAAASPRVAALSLGAEDFAFDLDMTPSEETLQGPRQQVVIAAAAAGVMPLGLVGGATRFDDPAGYLELARRSRRFGFAGASCIHPAQVQLLNQAFSPAAEEVAQAERIVAAAREAQAAGRGAFSLDGRMIDAPVVARAERLLARQAAVAARQARGAPSPTGPPQILPATE